MASTPAPSANPFGRIDGSSAESAPVIRRNGDSGGRLHSGQNDISVLHSPDLVQRLRNFKAGWRRQYPLASVEYGAAGVMGECYPSSRSAPCSGGRFTGGRPQWPSQSGSRDDKGRCEGARAGTVCGGGGVAARRRPFGAGCKGRALRGHRERSGGVTS